MMFTDRYRLKTLYAIGLMLFNLLIGFSVNAGIWRDNFNEEKLSINGEKLSDAWKPLNDLAYWKVADGLLWGKEVLNQWRTDTVTGLEMTRFVDHREHFTITVPNLQVRHPGPPPIGVALGNRVPAKAESLHVYGFMTSIIAAYKINWREKPKPLFGGTKPFDWVPQHPGTIWKDTRMELGKMTIHFNRGQFQLFAAGEMRADFVDEHFDQIEQIAIVTTVSEGLSGSVSIDSFSFSSSSLAVSPQQKLATSWAKVKGGFSGR